MKQNSVMRRLVAGAAGLAVGLAGAVALAAPAQATDYYKGDEGQYVVIEYHCDKTKVKVKAGDTNRNWMVNGTEQWINPGQDHTWPLDAAADVQVEWWHENSKAWKAADPSYVNEKDKRRDCPSGELNPLSSCELLVFVVENTGEKPIWMELTPTVDTTHGHAPTVLGETEIPEGTELVDPQEIMAGGTVGPLGPFEPGASHAHGFVGVEGLEVQVEVFTLEKGDKDKIILDETHAWMPGECEEEEENGGGGELPETGTSTTLIVAGALALLALGGGLFMIARRRRVTFTA